MVRDARLELAASCFVDTRSDPDELIPHNLVEARRFELLSACLKDRGLIPLDDASKIFGGRGPVRTGIIQFKRLERFPHPPRAHLVLSRGLEPRPLPYRDSALT